MPRRNHCLKSPTAPGQTQGSAPTTGTYEGEWNLLIGVKYASNKNQVELEGKQLRG
uniref:Uncharacterized protein n=1 Tax=viral metagenome TaxID=1070528 RepID=A0A6H1ZJY8_9ZZZZ